MEAQVENTRFMRMRMAWPRLMMALAMVMAVAPLTYSASASAATGTTKQWVNKYGGNLRAIEDDINNVNAVGNLSSNAAAGKSPPPRAVGPLCRSLEVDSVEMETLLVVPDIKLQAKLKVALKLLGQG